MDDVRPYIMWFYTGDPDPEVLVELGELYRIKFVEIQTHSGTTINEWINYYRSKNNAKVVILDKTLRLSPQDVVNLYSLQGDQVDLVFPQYDDNGWTKLYVKVNNFEIIKVVWRPDKT